VIADKAYSAAWLLDAFHRERIVPIIPNRADQPENPDLDRRACRKRNPIERLVGKLKRFRRVATPRPRRGRATSSIRTTAPSSRPLRSWLGCAALATRPSA
jgi:transposase